MIRNPIQALAKFLVKAELPEDLIENLLKENPEPTQDQLRELITKHEIEDPEEIEEVMYDLDRLGVDNLRRPKPHESNWQAVARKELAEKLGMVLEDLEEMSHPDDDVLQLEGKGVNDFNSESEWDVYENSDDAEYAAKEYIIESIDEYKGAVSEELLVRFTELDNTTINSIASDEADNYVDGLDDEEIKQMYLGHAASADDADDVDVGEATKQLISNHHDDISAQLNDDPLQYFKDMYGDEEALELFTRQGTLDKEGLAKYIVDTDGVGHTLDHYDGEAIELPSGAIAIGTN